MEGLPTAQRFLAPNQDIHTLTLVNNVTQIDQSPLYVVAVRPT